MKKENIIQVLELMQKIADLIYEDCDNDYDHASDVIEQISWEDEIQERLQK